jgi:carboxynorspermidine decarboxylase
MSDWRIFDWERLPSPCFVVDEVALRRNLSYLQEVQDKAGCRILLALKGFAMFSLFPVIRETLRGTCASSPHEARLGREEFGGEVHAFAAAYSESDIRQICQTADHIVFNSIAQWRRFGPLVRQLAPQIECGLRLNPEYSEVTPEIYNPCCRGSRLGIVRSQFDDSALEGISGLHFHTHCEQNVDSLERTLAVVEEKFGQFFRGLKWLNFGGGHHITRDDYDRQRLCQLIRDFRKRHGLEVYLEPGEAVALHTGVLVSHVLDIVHNEVDIAILDTSACAHMPDVLEMPYRPDIIGAGEPDEHAHTYRLAGLSCLAGDVIGDYSFPRPLRPGDAVVFLDMGHYSMVKTNTFNGIQLPAIAIGDSASGNLRVVREFGYEDFKGRLS